MDNKSDATFSVKYGPKDILDKSFKNKVRGYDPDEVDEFLDGIIRDYESFTAEIDRLNEENNRLFSRVDELTKQLNVSKNVATATPQAPSGNVTNYDILKRLSNLERHVFGSKLSDGGNSTQSHNNGGGIDQY
ncbi:MULTISPECIES: cell division regulator GpsB [Lacticaseibacillus]|jgi:DivIVA domain-containing protein|uniref:Cell cycle protein GpsB n=2 Tax=Lacticaseibacillus manihotivorans TaxID=88233 RepID=A0A0R1RB26_9LACO|nr:MULTISPECIES: cell division regulator GpsB [Lacticaseibacillus]KRL54304.1 cell division protein GpsB [Lacticaseibacillus manihotivorans DSM 13343 = JCM 12514]QFQ91415.1 cell division regulator GpsB [Lacticaseibacillus manihotivorans]